MEPGFNPEKDNIVPEATAESVDIEPVEEVSAAMRLKGEAITAFTIALPKNLRTLSEIERTGLRAELNHRIRTIEQLVAEHFAEKNKIANREVADRNAFAQKAIEKEQVDQNAIVYAENRRQLDELYSYLSEGATRLRGWLAELDAVEGKSRIIDQPEQ